MSDELTTFLETATDAVKVHADHVRAAFLAANHAITSKADTTIVTETDLAAERAMRALIADRHPTHAILGEELGATDGSAGASEYRWILDPIDGTTNFSRGIPLFVSAACLVRHGEPLVSAVYHPIFNDLYTAVSGQGAARDDTPLRLAAGQPLAAAVIGFTRRRDAKHRSGAMLDRLEPRVASFRVFGSGLYTLAQVATGRLDAVVALRQHIWDVLPSWLIAREAGAIAVDFTGQPWQPGGDELIVAHPDLATQLATVLSSVAEPA